MVMQFISVKSGTKRDSCLGNQTFICNNWHVNISQILHQLNVKKVAQMFSLK